MSREIKFRAWDKAFKKMQTHFSVHFAVPVNESNFELMQYTGLKDKNGKEIYEGDIITLDNILYQVDFNKKYAAFQLCHKHYSGEIFTNFFFEIIGCLKIVGNIYENEELLKNEHQAN